MDLRVAQRVRHELKFRLAEVVQNERNTPRMARLIFKDPSFAEFPSLAYDNHVKLFFPPDGGEPTMPVPRPNGLGLARGNFQAGSSRIHAAPLQ